jgi:Tat protein translocase TatB subunit
VNLGFSEVIVILFVALLVFGPNKLPELARNLGKFYRTINEWKSQIQGTFEEVINSETFNGKGPECEEMEPTEMGHVIDPNWKEGLPPKELNHEIPHVEVSDDLANDDTPPANDEEEEHSS